MIKLRDILRLRFAAELSVRQIARSQNISNGAVSKYINRALSANLSWPLPAELNDQALLNVLQPPRQSPEISGFAEPDFQLIHQELKRKGMTLQLLWEEYAQAQPQHYSYSHFTVRYRDWRGSQ